jgi:hypothetical protein
LARLVICALPALERSRARSDAMEHTCKNHGERAAMARCVACGAELCGTCRVRVDARNWCRPCVPDELKRDLPGHRAPLLAAILSVVPGFGQMYAGRAVRGLLFAGSAVAVAANVESIPEPIPLFLWLFNLFDAWSVALERNARVEGRELTSSETLQRRFFGLLGAGVAVFAAVRNTVAPQLSADMLWPASVVLYGLYLVFDRKGAARVER